MSSTAPREDRAPVADGAPPISRAAMADAMAHVRELHERERRPDEGLRERKKRLTRQLISDTATWMFCERGFDGVRVSEVADEVGVSEKTVFNYFPTKESLVFDQEDDLVEGVRSALTDRGPGRSPTQAMVAFIERECAHVGELPPQAFPMFLAFMELIDSTPALRAAGRRLAARLVDVARVALAESVGVDPDDPEPTVAAHALMALWEVQISSRTRYIRAEVPLAEMNAAVLADVHRAARLLDAGLGSFAGATEGASASRPTPAGATARTTAGATARGIAAATTADDGHRDDRSDGRQGGDDGGVDRCGGA